jgi:uncharacterized protein (TIGR02246 family)
MSFFRNAALCAMVLVMPVACAPGTGNTAADATAIKGESLVWFEKYNAGDAAGVAALYAEDAFLMAPGAPAIVGRAAIQEAIASDIAKSRAAGVAFKADEVTDIGVAGDLAWITGTFSVTDASGAVVDKGKYVTVYRRANGKWPIIRDIWNSDMSPAS